MQKRLFDCVVLALCLLLYAYFAWHYFQGPRSVRASAALRQEVAQLQATLTEEMHKRRGLETKVSLLRPEDLDPDMLDETARRLLDYGNLRELRLPR